MFSIFKRHQQESMHATVSGQMLALADVDDDVFSKKLLGDGFAITPRSNTIVAPTDGTIVSIFPTKHALTMRSSKGLEILIHMGLDTVELKGAPFTIYVNENESVKSGQRLADMNLALIQESNKATTVLTIISNMDLVESLPDWSEKQIKTNDHIGEIVLRPQH